MGTYTKFRFTNGKRHTAGLVLETTKLKAMTFPQVSRLFPVFESPKMHRLELSPEYANFEDAFNHQFGE